MEWNVTWEDPLTSYVKQFDGLIGREPASLIGYAPRSGQ